MQQGLAAIDARVGNGSTCCLLSAYPYGPYNRGPEWLESQSNQTSLTVTDDPERADVIIFVENHPGRDSYFFDVLNHPIRRGFPDRSVLYHDADRSVTLMPTLSPSIEAWQTRCHMLRSFHYLVRLCENDAVNQCSEEQRVETSFRYSASFVGSSRTHSLRKVLLERPLTDGYYLDTKEQRAWEMASVQKRDYERLYVEVMLSSRFVLCPRGVGPSTYRLYEALQVGRVPVIISDEWVPPRGPDWNSFSIQVQERDIAKLGSILAHYFDRAGDMGLKARAAWERYFSPAVALRRLVEEAFDLLKARRPVSDKMLACIQYLRRGHARRLGGWALRSHITGRNSSSAD